MKNEFVNPNEYADTLLSDFKTLHIEVSEKYREISVIESNIDKEINDIYHYIEFYDLSASEGFKIYKLLQEQLQKRRKIKNSIKKLNLIKTALGNFKENGGVDKTIQTLETQQYHPRVLKDLFNEKPQTFKDIFNEKRG